MQIHEPVEVRLSRPNSKYTKDTVHLVLTAWQTPEQTVAYRLDNGRGSTPQSLSHIHATVPFPSKAVGGWQDEVVDAVRSSAFADSIILIR